MRENDLVRRAARSVPVLAFLHEGAKHFYTLSYSLRDGG